MGGAGLGERETQRLLGAGLADRAGDRDDLCPGARARGPRQIGEAGEDVGHDEQRSVGRHRVPLGLGDHREAGAGRKRRRNEFVAVAGIAMDGEERLAAAMVRLSIDSPATISGSGPARAAPMAAAIASTLHGARSLMRPPSSIYRCAARPYHSFDKQGKS